MNNTKVKKIIKYETSCNKDFIKKYLIDTKNEYIEKQMRALYECREIYKDDIDEIIKILTFALKNNNSILLKHEIAYVLGQISNKKCNQILIDLLENKNEHVMIRHEAAEGLAAIGSLSNINIIKKFINDEHIEVKETCHLALCSLLEKNKKYLCSCIHTDKNKKKYNVNDITNENNINITDENNTNIIYENNIIDENNINIINEKNIIDENNEEITNEINIYNGSRYKAIDPVIITRNNKNVNELINNLFNKNLPLQLRYEALFELRNIETKEALNAINEVLIKDDSSAIFRHEVAFVLGQVLNLDSLKFLIKSLENISEHEMVRHEVALALGSLGSLNLKSNEYKNIQNEIIEILKKFSNDECTVVAESCLVGLDYIAENLNIQIEIY